MFQSPSQSGRVDPSDYGVLRHPGQTVQIILASPPLFWEDGCAQLHDYLVAPGYAAAVRSLCDPVKIDGSSLLQGGPFKMGLFAAHVRPGGCLTVITEQLAEMTAANCRTACVGGLLGANWDSGDTMAYTRSDMQRTFPVVKKYFEHIP